MSVAKSALELAELEAIGRLPAPRGICLMQPHPVWDYNRDLEQVENNIVRYCRSVGVPVLVTSRLRTCQEQSNLYASGQSTAAPTTSQHEFGLAFDLVPADASYKQFGTFAQCLQWLAYLARYVGVDALVESNHTHVQWYGASAWRAMIAARDIGTSIPLPSKKPKT